MAFSTPLQQALNYLKQGHAVLPPSRSPVPTQQFNAPRVAPVMTPPTAAFQPVQPMQGTMPQSAPQGIRLR